MKRQAQLGTVFTLLTAGMLAASGARPIGAAPADTVTEGTIDSVSPGAIAVASRAGGVTLIRLSATTIAISRQTASLEAIQPGDFIGVAAKRLPDGLLSAISINIFPPEFRGRAREGQFPMASGDTMTNAVVMQQAVRVDGRTLYLKYKDGAAAITVPPTADVHRLTAIPVAALRPGMHVTVRGAGNPDGSVSASTITVDQAGQS